MIDSILQVAEFIILVIFSGILLFFIKSRKKFLQDMKEVTGIIIQSLSTKEDSILTNLEKSNNLLCELKKMKEKDA